MLWRLWAFVSGLGVGAMIALAALRNPTPLQLAWSALAAGVALSLVVWLLARGHDDEHERGGHLATAASFGWAALPASVAVFFAWSPGPWVYVGLVLATLAVALFFATRALGPAGSLLSWVLRAVAATVVAGSGVLALAATGAVLLAPPPAIGARLSATLYAIDAEVVTRPLPICGTEPRATAVLLDRGAHPALSPDGAFLWFDAASDTDGGRRQIHRMERANGSVTCWTCSEPGNNVHPSVSPSGVSVVFQSDRHANWLHPDDTELYLAAAEPRTDKHDPGRRISFTPGPDDAPIFGPGSMMVTWSRREAGRYEVVAASIRAGHGGLLLGAPGVLASGGAQWIAPIAWSPDGRTLAVARGNPFAALTAEAIDATSGTRALLAENAAPAASFDGDGGYFGFATTRPLHFAGLLPSALGFAIAPLATAMAGREPLWRDSGIHRGATGQPRFEGVAGTQPATRIDAQPVALAPEIASWGEPTGLAIEPDASGFVLGQRRSDERGVQERLVSVQLACTQTATAPRAAATR